MKSLRGLLLLTVFAIASLGFAGGAQASADGGSQRVDASAAKAAAAADKSCGRTGRLQVRILGGNISCSKARRTLRKFWKRVRGDNKRCTGSTCRVAKMDCQKMLNFPDLKGNPTVLQCSNTSGSRMIWARVR